MISNYEYMIEHDGYQAAPGGPCGPGGCAWVAGMMYVHEEDLDTVAEARPVECESCERVYEPARRDDPGYLRPEIDAPGGSERAAEGSEADDGSTGVSGLPWAGTG